MRNTVLIMSLCFSLTALSQDFKFGKISKEELKETVCSIDSSANAAYLYKFRKTYDEYRKDDGFELITEVHERLKIYNQEGFNYATKRLRLYKGSTGSQEKISTLKAYTYNLENGKIVEVKLNKSDIFKSEANKYTNEVKFTMPNIKQGTIIEYKYKINSPFWSNVDEFVFQHTIPIKKLEASFEVPEYYTFKLSTKGFLSIVPTIEYSQGVISFTNKTRSTIKGNNTGLTAATISTSEVKFNKQISKYNLENIPALKDEPYVNNINNYRSSAKYELSYTQFPDSYPKTYSTSWQAVVDRIYKSERFGGELEKAAYFKKDIDALVNTISDPAEKMELIFNFVKSQVKWNGYYGFYADSVKKAFKDHVGNSGDINLMLTAMLRYAGINSNPVLVSTRTHGIPLFPTREGYNYVVASVKLPDNSVVLLDATSEYAAPNVLPFRALNWQGRLVAENGSSELIDLYPKTKSNNSITMMVKVNAEGVLDGSIRSVKTKHKALLFRKKYNATDKDDFIEKLENNYNGIEITDYQVKNESNLSKPISESYSFEKDNQADIIGDKIYFSPLFFYKTTENPFKLEKREFPVDFGYPSLTSYRINLKIPEGYKIESIPESAAIALPDNLGAFHYKVVGQGNTIQISIKTQINQSIISPIYYDALKTYFSQLVEKEAEQIVITKG
ncbi:DUF3857 domain-containing protein [Algibacter sp. R77976]|uniref:DUF3857 domain-containing protein n=1 Tax=Algibacter sp. R77976 TaxID=3093873 RepID=UPI0037CAE70C